MTDRKNENALLCDTATGMCEMPGTKNGTEQVATSQGPKPVKIIYFTDPICSSCWGIEPQLRRLKMEYGDVVEVEYRMGGLLPDWSYNAGGISKPADVAHHWEEVSAYYEMPIDGGVWLQDPLPSSYPPSIAFKAAQMQDEGKAVNFLRHLREQVFLLRHNITRWEHISAAAVATGLDTARLHNDYNGSIAKQLFEADLTLAARSGVRGFPTLFVLNAAGEQTQIYGARPYAAFEAAVLKVHPTAQKATNISADPVSLLERFPTLAPKEYSVLAGISYAAAVAQLDGLVAGGHLRKYTFKNGALYSLAAREDFQQFGQPQRK